jgi:hypothetical protein
VTGLGIELISIGTGSLLAACFFGLNPEELATRVATVMAGISAGLGNRYWVKRERRLRWLFAFILGVIGLGFVIAGIATMLGHGAATT